MSSTRTEAQAMRHVVRLALGVIGAAMVTTVMQAQVVRQAPAPQPPPTMIPVTINANAGDQSDPHVSGDWAAYTSDVAIRYYNFVTAADAEIPMGTSARDMLSDISGSKIVFSRTFSGVKTAIMVFDATTPATLPLEIDPDAGSIRLGSAIGGNTVAYIDYGLQDNGELVIHDLIANTSERITNDAAFDINPAVSPDGGVVTWEHCVTSQTNCDIWQAVKTGSSWTVSVVSDTANPESNPDTNGTLVVYDSVRAGNGDIFWKPVTGGAEVQLQKAGIEGNPNIAGNFIAFESRASVADATDLFVYDVVNNRLFQITSTPLVNEQLNEITVLPDGRVRVVWASDEDGLTQRNLKAATFSPPAVISPTDLLQQLIALVQSFHFRPAIQFTLEGELWIANALITSTNPTVRLGACGWLHLFIQEVQALKGHGITAAQAAQLVTLANDVRASLGCP